MIVTLFEEKRKDISILITAELESNGDLLISGIDSGTLVNELKGSMDYEYKLRLLKADKESFIKNLGGEDPSIKSDADLLKWLQLKYNTNQAFSNLLQLLEQMEIKRESFFWP